MGVNRETKVGVQRNGQTLYPEAVCVDRRLSGNYAITQGRPARCRATLKREGWYIGVLHRAFSPFRSYFATMKSDKASLVEVDQSLWISMYTLRIVKLSLSIKRCPLHNTDVGLLARSAFTACISTIKVSSACLTMPNIIRGSDPPYAISVLIAVLALARDRHRYGIPENKSAKKRDSNKLHSWSLTADA